MSLRPVCHLLLGLAFVSAQYTVIAAGLSVLQSEARFIHRISALSDYFESYWRSSLEAC